VLNAFRDRGFGLRLRIGLRSDARIALRERRISFRGATRIAEKNDRLQVGKAVG
jgi:hypothetical protein